MNALPRGSYNDPIPRTRPILLQSPIVRGLDVRIVQLALSSKGYKIVADGIFGNNSAKIVPEFQQSASLPVRGSVDITGFDMLDI